MDLPIIRNIVEWITKKRLTVPPPTPEELAKIKDQIMPFLFDVRTGIHGVGTTSIVVAVYYKQNDSPEQQAALAKIREIAGSHVTITECDMPRLC